METRLCDIKPGDSDLTIRARVCRLWRGRLLMDKERNDGLQCVLIDRHNNPIHAIVSEADYDDVVDKIKLGSIYEITNFHASKTPDVYIIVPHETQLMFNNRTIFNELDEVYPPYPKYWFQFVDYFDLSGQKGDDNTLIDVIGWIDKIYDPEDVFLSGKMVPKRSIEIYNLRREKLTVNLWGRMAIDYDISAVQREMYPVVAVFTSTKVRTFGGAVNVSSGMCTCIFYNPSLPETEEYKRTFIGPEYAPKIIKGPAGTKRQRGPVDMSNMDIISIKALNVQRTPADGNKDTSFFIKGEITKIMCQQQWHYMGCPRCLKQVRMIDGYSTPRCGTHTELTGEAMYKLQVRVEDSTDSVTIMALGRGGEFLFGIPCNKLFRERREGDKRTPPPELMKFMGETRIFELVYGSRSDFVIKGVFNETAVRIKESSTLPTPEKVSYKRTNKNQRDVGALESSQPEPIKKLKSLSNQLLKQKEKQIEGRGKSVGKQVVGRRDLNKDSSDEDEDFTLSQMFEQQLSEKRASKALVIGKKTSEQPSKSPVTARKISERIKIKNKSKME